MRRHSGMRTLMPITQEFFLNHLVPSKRFKMQLRSTPKACTANFAYHYLPNCNCGSERLILKLCCWTLWDIYTTQIHTSDAMLQKLHKFDQQNMQVHASCAWHLRLVLAVCCAAHRKGRNMKIEDTWNGGPSLGNTVSENKYSFHHHHHRAIQNLQTTVLWNLFISTVVVPSCILLSLKRKKKDHFLMVNSFIYILVQKHPSLMSLYSAGPDARNEV